MSEFPQPQRFRRDGARKLRRPYGAHRKPRPLRSGQRARRPDLGPPKSFACRDYLYSSSPFDALLPGAGLGFRPRLLPAVTLALGPGWANALHLSRPDSPFWASLNALRHQLFSLTGLTLPAVAVNPGHRPYQNDEPPLPQKQHRHDLPAGHRSDWDASVSFGLQPIVWGRREADPNQPLLPLELLRQAVRKCGSMLLTEDTMVNMLVEVARRHRGITGFLRFNGLYPALIQILRDLVDESVSIRDFVRILESLLDGSRRTRDTQLLREIVRIGLGRQLVAAHNTNGCLHGIELSAEWEAELAGDQPGLSPQRGAALLRKVGAALSLHAAKRPVLLSLPRSRFWLRQLVSRAFPELAVLSWNEIASATAIDVVATV